MSANNVNTLTIRPAQDAAEIELCAEMMSQSEPWLTLKRDAAFNFKLLQDSRKELYVAAVGQVIAGHLLIDMNGTFAGYVQVLAVHPDWRSRGVGAKLMAWAEERIFRDSPNVFLCVAEFNSRAQEFYARLGYEQIGRLKDYVIAGSAEMLMRKTIGPKGTFRPAKTV